MRRERIACFSGFESVSQAGYDRTFDHLLRVIRRCGENTVRVCAVEEGRSKWLVIGSGACLGLI
jgi:hypothetical protein